MLVCHPLTGCEPFVDSLSRRKNVMSTGALKRMSWSEYLQQERQAETKSEFYDGDVFAMAGATRRHNLIAINVAAELRNVLRESPCETYGSDMRIRCPDGLGTYPDASVACDPLFEDDTQDTLLNPVVIVEVLSPSTEAYDRGRKFQGYRGIPSLREYLLVSQDRCLIEHYVRQSEFDGWLLTTISEPDDQIALPTLGVSLRVGDVFARVDFSARDSDEAAGDAPDGVR
jgi:Uma2 family endonuclease